MALQILRNPETGLYSIFNSALECFVIREATEDQVIKWYAIAAADVAREALQSIQRGDPQELSYGDAIAIIREFNPEGEDAPIMQERAS